MGDRSRPRVLMLTSTLPRWPGDSEPRFVLDLARHLSAEFDIELVAPHAPGAATSEELDGVQVTRFRYWIPRWQSVAYQGGITWRLRENPLRLFQLPFFAVAMGWHVYRRLRGGPPVDLVHAHWIVPQAAVAIAVRRMAGRRVPIVTTSHGGDLFGLRSRVWRSVKRWALERSDAVTVVSSAMAERVRDLVPGSEPAVIPMGTELASLFTPPPEPRTGPPKRLIFVGRLVEKKGVTYLLHALPDVLREHPELTLDIVGHGPLRQELEAQAEALGLANNVTFHGPVPHSQLPDYYRRADVAVFPFVEAASGDQEGFGLVMVEAMGCGCAVIASRLPATGDVIRNAEVGWLVPPRDTEALSAAIREIVDSASLAQATAERGRRQCLASFDWAVISERFSQLFSSRLRGDTRRIRAGAGS